MTQAIPPSVQAWLADPAVRSAVELLLKRGARDKVGLENTGDPLLQTDYRKAFLAAQEVYVEWQRLLQEIWQAVWVNNKAFPKSLLTPLSAEQIVKEGWDLPTLENAWLDDWFGTVYHTSAGRLIGLYVYGDTEKSFLNVRIPDLPKRFECNGWEDDEEIGELNSIAEAFWDEKVVDLAALADPATAMLERLVSL